MGSDGNSGSAELAALREKEPGRSLTLGERVALGSRAWLGQSFLVVWGVDLFWGGSQAGISWDHGG